MSVVTTHFQQRTLQIEPVSSLLGLILRACCGSCQTFGGNEHPPMRLLRLYLNCAGGGDRLLGGLDVSTSPKQLVLSYECECERPQPMFRLRRLCPSTTSEVGRRLSVTEWRWVEFGFLPLQLGGHRQRKSC